MRWTTLVLKAALLIALSGPDAGAQAAGTPATTITIVGPRYEAGALRRLLLGPGYRDLWTAPVAIDVLDLRAFAGGLVPVKQGGRKQTRSLHFDAADGRRFKARSVDKVPGRVLPKIVRPLAESIVEDTTSALLPAGALAVAPLQEAAGILHVKPALVILPDDALLGEFRQEFAGMVVTLEEIPTPGRTVGFEEVIELLDWEALAPRLAAGPAERVDTRAFLRTRLLDLWLGDWDRHDLQLEWARVEGREGWQPVPVDRDAAFSMYDGLVVDLLRPWQRRFVRFDHRYPDVTGLTWNARLIDRRFLAGHEWPVWGETAADLQRRLTDAVIDGAVKHLPPEYARLEGHRLAGALKSRRERLPEVARQHYLRLADGVAIEATDAAERVEATFGADGSLEVAVSAAGAPRPYVRRRFLPQETSEVGLLLAGGDDLAVVRGDPSPRIRLHIVGGPGDDVIDDSAAGGTRVHDDSGADRVLRGPGTRIDETPYVHPKDTKDDPMRDGGSVVMCCRWRRRRMPASSAGAAARGAPPARRRRLPGWRW